MFTPQEAKNVVKVNILHAYMITCLKDTASPVLGIIAASIFGELLDPSRRRRRVVPIGHLALMFAARSFANYFDFGVMETIAISQLICAFHFTGYAQIKEEEQASRGDRSHPSNNSEMPIGLGSPKYAGFRAGCAVFFNTMAATISYVSTDDHSMGIRGGLIMAGLTTIGSLFWLKENLSLQEYMPMVMSSIGALLSSNTSNPIISYLACQIATFLFNLSSFANDYYALVVDQISGPAPQARNRR